MKAKNKLVVSSIEMKEEEKHVMFWLEKDISKVENTDCKFLLCHVRVSEWIHNLYCLNVNELLARSRREIWSLSDCKWTRTQNHLARKLTTQHIAPMDFAEYLRKSDVSDNGKVYYTNWTSWKAFLY